MKPPFGQCVEIVQVEEDAFTKAGRPRLNAFEVWVTSTEQCSVCVKAKEDSRVIEDHRNSGGRLSFNTLSSGGHNSLKSNRDFRNRVQTSVLNEANNVLNQADKSLRGSLRPPARTSLRTTSQGSHRSSSTPALRQSGIPRQKGSLSAKVEFDTTFNATSLGTSQATTIYNESRRSTDRHSTSRSSLSGKSSQSKKSTSGDLDRESSDESERGRRSTIESRGSNAGQRGVAFEPPEVPQVSVEFLQQRLAERAELDKKRAAVAKNQMRTVEREERQARFAALAAPTSAQAIKTIEKMSEEHCLTPAELMDAKETFDRFDADGSGSIDIAEFGEVLCRSLGFASVDELPPKMLNMTFLEADQDGSAALDFEEFLTWWKANRFEEALMLDYNQIQIRVLARKHNLDIMTADEIHRQFVRFDTDGSGSIELSEFKEILLRLLNIKEEDLAENRLMKFWREVDNDGSGAIDFEEFMLWYYKYFGMNKKGTHKTPMQSFYQSYRPAGGYKRRLSIA
eukprot:gnl/MRDRNA2_/MRDRNA2_96657_c0_seq1.p1 gnl/MRDRNA2_/MRDRNA2_96657_c0~~gnl/MRDRNA2_/MRDRNA2_96657_c0_seq1.p1  ORF type:complete len:511 (-),score=102.54 gnl/MRDRNA2_/MRDRNA2_96657_c0_seq1:69-1601(-)